MKDASYHVWSMRSRNIASLQRVQDETPEILLCHFEQRADKGHHTLWRVHVGSLENLC